MVKDESIFFNFSSTRKESEVAHKANDTVAKKEKLESTTTHLTLEILLNPASNRHHLPEQEGMIDSTTGLPMYSAEFLMTYRGHMRKLPVQGKRGKAFRFTPPDKPFDMLGKYVQDIDTAHTITGALEKFNLIHSEHERPGLAFPLGAVIERRTTPGIGIEDNLFTFTEFISDTSLAAYRAEAGKIQGDEWFGIMKQLSRSIGILHSYDIAHRDLHPRNVLMKNNKTIIVDPDELTQTPTATNGSRAFTDGYLLLDFLAADNAKRQDICQLGMVGFELYTGIDPLEYARDEIGEHASFLKKDQALEAIAKNVDNTVVAHILKSCVDYDNGFTNIQHLRDALDTRNLPAVQSKEVDLVIDKDEPFWNRLGWGTAGMLFASAIQFYFLGMPYVTCATGSVGALIVYGQVKQIMEKRKARKLALADDRSDALRLQIEEGVQQFTEDIKALKPYSPTQRQIRQAKKLSIEYLTSREFHSLRHLVDYFKKEGFEVQPTINELLVENRSGKLEITHFDSPEEFYNLLFTLESFATEYTCRSPLVFSHKELPLDFEIILPGEKHSNRFVVDTTRIQKLYAFESIGAILELFSQDYKVTFPKKPHIHSAIYEPGALSWVYNGDLENPTVENIIFLCKKEIKGEFEVLANSSIDILYISYETLQDKMENHKPYSFRIPPLPSDGPFILKNIPLKSSQQYEARGHSIRNPYQLS